MKPKMHNQEDYELDNIYNKMRMCITRLPATA